ncbi:uncharacterized protein F5891DRAFT_1088229 [Suillus fuscotomentosus]|uniref:F-box domain-containing protein n=1 Tax=Suillus fuscotomentosus TaxID=1912939 RepID=A0AAD4DN62_9AGAM|nr:uncharacterized protein F5891DRAFT_1088229 [Suillus fuscotomentosus]KAG1885276.1 hypothetical protein F5891DRAFT_1088229 [Suillus fuscotomentosus]
MGQLMNIPSRDSGIIPQVGLPPELWSAIFEHLPLRTLHDVTLTCHSFRYLAQPLLFRSLTFCPYSLDANNQRFIHRLETVKRTKRRIQFCSSVRIAHAVRECKFYPRYIVGAVLNTAIPYNVLLDILLDTLPLFVNLQSLSFMFVDLSQSQISKLCALRSLGNLFLGNCTVEHVLSLSSPKLRLANLTIICDSKNMLGNGQNGHGLSVFSPDHIRSVSIINPVAASQLLNNFIGNASQGLLQLRCLTLPCNLEVVRAFRPILHLIPELAELKFARPSQIQHNLPRDENFSLSTHFNPLKPLSKYQGPRQLLPHFVRPGALEHLNLWSTRPVSTDGSMSPLELHGALAGGNKLVSVCDPEVLKTVQMLELSVTHVDALMLHVICIRFPILRSLYVFAAKGFFPGAVTQAWDPEVIMDALLTLPLPSTIRHLRLSSYSAGSRSGTATEDRLVRHKQDLRVKYPNLSSVSLDESDIDLTWDRSTVLLHC